MMTGWAVTVMAALGSGPYAFGPSGGYVSGEVTASGVYGAPHAEQLHPYEMQAPWLHGYYQEIPAYGGFHAFKPYNYKHLLAQSQTAAGFGMSPVMPYSQQFWHRYENRANLSPYANEPGTDLPMSLPPGMTVPPSMGAPPSMMPPSMMPMPQAMPYGMPGAAVEPFAPAAAPSAPAEWHRGEPVILPARAEAPVPAGGRWSGWQPPTR